VLDRAVRTRATVALQRGEARALEAAPAEAELAALAEGAVRAAL